MRKAEMSKENRIPKTKEETFAQLDAMLSYEDMPLFIHPDDYSSMFMAFMIKG
jgi:hypothetical protein